MRSVRQGGSPMWEPKDWTRHPNASAAPATVVASPVRTRESMLEGYGGVRWLASGGVRIWTYVNVRMGRGREFIAGADGSDGGAAWNGVMFNASLIPLHAGHMSFGFFPGLLFSILAVILITKLIKHGRLGPVRFDPHRTAEAGAHEGPGRRPGPPWAQGFGPGSGSGFGSGFGWGQPSPEDAALATLADRLAKGEISPEEYLERSTALRGAAGPKEG